MTDLIQPLPVVVIAGRPNVGKSTLFNRLSGRRHALVSDTPGECPKCGMELDAETPGKAKSNQTTMH